MKNDKEILEQIQNVLLVGFEHRNNLLANDYFKTIELLLKVIELKCKVE